MRPAAGGLRVDDPGDEAGRGRLGEQRGVGVDDDGGGRAHAGAAGAVGDGGGPGSSLLTGDGDG